MANQVCENCGKSNPIEDSYCFSCGHILPTGLKNISTQHLEDSKNLRPQLRWGTAYFGDRTILRIHIREKSELIETQFTDECILGRTIDTDKVHIDLTPYGALEKGVSREHAKLTRRSETIMVEDLNSSNGTFLNGQKLLAHQPRVLRNEDELVLGHMIIRVSFMSAPNSR